MVATLVALRFLVLKNTLKRNPWQLVLAIIGAVYGAGLMIGLIAGLIALNLAPPSISRTIVICAGSALIIGWVMFPLLLSGIDQTLEPARLSVFPIPLNTLLVGLLVCGVLGVPGIVTTIASLATALSWLAHPAIAVVALICGAIGALTCVVASRAVTAVSVGFSSGRRFREVGGILAFIPLILLGPIAISLTTSTANASNALPSLAEALSWTPIGAIWAVPSSVAVGDFAGAGIRFAIGVALLGALVALWRWGLARALVTPAHTSSRVRAAGTGRLGLLARFPGTPTGAVAARCLTYWFRDPRYTRQLLVVPVFPALMFFYSNLFHSLGFTLAAGPLVAFLLALAIFSDVSYDNTAFALHVSSGVAGAADRAGRVIALSTFAVPVVILLTVGSGALTGSWPIVPGLLGLALGVLATGMGVSSVTSARFVFPVPLPGTNPFTSRAGANMTNTLTAFAVWGVLWALALPEIALLVLAIVTGWAVFSWLGLVVGIGLGATLLVVGIRRGGRLLDRRSMELLAQLTKDR